MGPGSEHPGNVAAFLGKPDRFELKFGWILPASGHGLRSFPGASILAEHQTPLTRCLWIRRKPVWLKDERPIHYSVLLDAEIWHDRFALPTTLLIIDTPREEF